MRRSQHSRIFKDSRGQSIKRLHGLERWRRLTCKLFDKASLRRH
jgi:hypothetical protein